MQTFESERDVISCMFYNLLEITSDADEGTIKYAFADKYKAHVNDPGKTQKLNDAKTCLTNFACRTRYNEALVRFGVNDGAGIPTGMQEVPTNKNPLPTVPTPTA